MTTMVANLVEVDASGDGLKPSKLPWTNDSPQHPTVDLAAGALASLPSAIIVLNDCYNIVYANDAARRLVDSNRSSPNFGANGDFSFTTPSEPSSLIGTHISKLGLAVFSVDKRRLQPLCRTASSVVQRACHTQFKRLCDNSYHICDRDSNPESSIFCSAPLDLQVWTAENGERYITISFDLPFVPNRLPVFEPPTPHETPRDERISFDINPLQEPTPSETRRGYERGFAHYAQHIFLKDANGRSGYFVSGDESVVVCNYRGGAREVHHPKCLEDFVITQWTVYDTFFEKLVPLDEFPFIKYTRERKAYKTQYGYTTAEDERMILDVQGYPLYASDGEYLGSANWVKVLGSYDDFHSDQDLEKLHSHEAVLELLPHYTWTCTPAWGIEFFSKSWCDYTNILSPYREGWKKAIHPEDLQGLMDHIACCTLKKEIVKTHVRYKRYDGVWRWCAFTASPLTNGRGEILKWFGSTTDIHESWMAYREQFEWSSRVLATLSSVPINLFATDGNGKLVLLEGGLGIPPWNERYSEETVTHGSLQLMLGINMLDWMLCHHDPAGLPQLLRDCLAGTRETGEVEELVQGTWIKTTVKAHIKMTPDGRKVVDQVVGCTVDITEAKALRNMERENAKILVEKNTALESNRLKSQFLASMSHELRTPIAGIMGMSSLLADMENRTEEEMDCVDGIKTSAAKLLSLVNDLLDHSKIEAGKFEVERVPFEVHNVFKSIIQAFKHSLEQKGIRFEYSLDIPSSLSILGDSLRLSQILSNVISNAIKFSHQNGSIHFSASLCFGESTDMVKFIIKDTGIGITPEVLQTLFVPFKQGDSSTSRVYGGTGLGLVISKNLTELMGGRLELGSVPNKGTTIIVTIPAIPATTLSLELLPPLVVTRSRSPQDDFNHQYAREGISGPLLTAPPSRQSSPAPTSPRPVRILIAEDNAINAKIAIKTVKKLGYETVHCWNGQQTLDYLIDDGNPPVDLILMDCQMPVLDGYAATEALRNETMYTSKKRLEGLPVVALTASAIKGDKEKALAAGMDFYMMKPFTKERLDEVLKIWLKRRREVKKREVCGDQHEHEHRPRMLERNTVG